MYQLLARALKLSERESTAKDQISVCSYLRNLTENHGPKEKFKKKKNVM